MDRIVECLALELLPALERLDCLETFFAPERLAYIDATREGPPAGHTLSPTWSIEQVTVPQRTVTCSVCGPVYLARRTRVVSCWRNASLCLSFLRYSKHPGRSTAQGRHRRSL